MKAVNPQKEKIIVLVNRLLSRSGLNIDQVVARMQINGCEITRNVFENRFTTRVHQKPNIPVDWLLALLRAFTQKLAVAERCQFDEALELFQLARVPLDHLTDLQQLFPDVNFTAAVEKLIPISYANPHLLPTNADNLLTDIVSYSSATPGQQIHNLADFSPKIEWGEAPEAGAICGREREIARLEEWIQQESCRLIGVFGMGGVGKTLLTTQVVRNLQSHFAYIYWGSLRSAPTLPQLLGDYLQFFLNTTELPPTVNKRSCYVCYAPIAVCSSSMTTNRWASQATTRVTTALAMKTMRNGYVNWPKRPTAVASL
jgi:hypothetical protein